MEGTDRNKNDSRFCSVLAFRASWSSSLGTKSLFVKTGSKGPFSSGGVLLVVVCVRYDGCWGGGAPPRWFFIEKKKDLTKILPVGGKKLVVPHFGAFLVMEGAFRVRRALGEWASLGTAHLAWGHQIPGW